MSTSGLWQLVVRQRSLATPMRTATSVMLRYSSVITAPEQTECETVDSRRDGEQRAYPWLETGERARCRDNAAGEAGDAKTNHAMTMSLLAFMVFRSCILEVSVPTTWYRRNLLK